MSDSTASPHLALNQPRPKRRSSRIAPVMPYCFAIFAILVVFSLGMYTFYLLNDPSSPISLLHQANGTPIDANGTLSSPTLGNSSRSDPFVDPPDFTRLAFVQGLVDHVTLLLQNAHGLVDIHYWYTRSVSTGISLLPVVLASLISNLVPPNIYESTLLNYVLTSLGELVLEWPIFNLWLRLEWSWGGLAGLVATSVRKRRAAHQEKASDRIERGLGSWQRCGVVAALLFAHAFGSYVSQTSPPSPLNVTESTWSSIVLVCLSSVRSVSGDYVLLSQIRHNEAAHTFAGMHTLSAWISALKSLLSCLGMPILALFFGSDIQVPELSGLLAIALHLVLLSQAVRFPTVSQKIEEED